MPIAVALAASAALATDPTVPWKPAAQEPDAGAAPRRGEGAVVSTTRPHRSIDGDLAVYVPPSLSLRDGAFDLVVHFHGAAAFRDSIWSAAELRQGRAEYVKFVRDLLSPRAAASQAVDD